MPISIQTVTRREEQDGSDCRKFGLNFPCISPALICPRRSAFSPSLSLSLTLSPSLTQIR